MNLVLGELTFQNHDNSVIFLELIRQTETKLLMFGRTTLPDNQHYPASACKIGCAFLMRS
jgi:hypothetical protein